MIALCTDGVFDVFSNEDTIDFIENAYEETNNLQTAVNSLVDDATNRWKADLPFDVRVDDITCVCTRFEVERLSK